MKSKVFVAVLLAIIVFTIIPDVSFAAGNTPTPNLNEGTISGLPAAGEGDLETLIKKSYNWFFVVMLMIAVGWLVYHKSNLGNPDEMAAAKAKKGVFWGYIGIVGLGLTWTIVGWALSFGQG